MIPVANPGAEVRALYQEILDALESVMSDGRYIQGPESDAFEKEFAAFCRVSAGIGVASGTDALHLALRGLGLGAGDEVITASHTAIATVAAIQMAGATPILVDVEPDTYTIDPERLTAAIGPKTAAVLPVHLYGQVCDMDAVMTIARRSGLKVIEDCAQAHGATYGDHPVGGFGDAGCFSFYPTKNLGALGDGGMIVSNDLELVERLRRLRQYGWDKDRLATEAGWNSRLDDIHAAVLRVKLSQFDARARRRRDIAAQYDAAFRGLPMALPVARPHATHAYHLYVVALPDTSARDRMRSWLSDQEIGTSIHYPVPVHLQPAYHGRIETRGGMTVTEDLASRIISLPLYPDLTDDEVESVCAAVASFFSAEGASFDAVAQGGS